jgi:uncharacterized repeat protein (TIGR02543 family)
MVTLTATPDAGQVFTGWTGGGCSTAVSCTIPINASVTITARFTAATAAIGEERSHER